MRFAFAGGLLMLSTLAHAETVNLYAAGSLKAAMTEVAKAFEKSKGDKVRVETSFGPSGLLRERIEKGEPAHVFASADTDHPKRLADQGRSIGQVRVGTSTPKADPAGDYAFALFARAEKLKPGAQATLEGRALQLTGGPTSEKAPADRNPYAWVMETGKADLFLTYCTNAMLAKREVPALQIVPIPADLSVGADYGMIVHKQAPAAAIELAQFMLGKEGQTILASHGFGLGDPAK